MMNPKKTNKWCSKAWEKKVKEYSSIFPLSSSNKPLIHFENMFNLLKGDVEKVFIRTGETCYVVKGKEVVCKINTLLMIRYTSGSCECIAGYNAEGVSRCAPEDRFNLLTGIKLATARAENDYNNYYRKLLHKYYSSSISLAGGLNTLLNNCSTQLIHNNCQFIPSLMDKK